jgi:hypothetical protein
MQSIPRPGLLERENPEQVLTSRERDVDAWGRIAEPMREIAQYANQLWEVVQGVREYLYELAGEGGKPSPLRDASDWEDWAETWARVTSALAGPAGDSGYGVGEAREIAQRHGTQVGTGRTEPT